MRDLRKQIISASRELHARGWVANHDGNITIRLAGARFLATPTATSKADVDARNLIEVDAAGKRVAGSARPFSELSVHLALYAAREDVGAVVHAHPPYATAIACSASRALEQPFLAEAVVSLGASIPTLAFEPPGAAAAAQVAAAAASVDAVLCAGNGVFAWGADLETARLRLELVEHLAKIATLALPHGGTQALPADVVRSLLEKRAKSGLGAAADGAVSASSASSASSAASASPPRVIACAPAPHANVSVISPPRAADREGDRRAELAATIREEIIAVLRDGEQ